MLFLNILVGLALLLCLFVRWMPAEYFPFFAIFSLVTPFFLVLTLLFLVYWLFLKHKNILVSAVPLVASIFIMQPFYKWGSQPMKIADTDITIMSYNTRNFNKNEQLKLRKVDSLILDFVTEQNPDIVCFQEFHHKMKRSNALAQYPYKFVDFIFGEHKGKVIQAVYSKYPILDVEQIDFPKSANSAIYADILIDKDTIRLYNLHLQSFSIVPEVNSIEKQKYNKVIAKMKKVMRLQKEQAIIIREHMAKSPYKTLVVGDFNATQFSNAYHTLAKDFSDSYFEAGKGFGRTYNLKGYPMRIDYILADKHFEFTSHTNYDNRYSDHYPIMASCKLVSDE